MHLETAMLLTSSTTIAELLAGHPVAARVLVDRRMHCVGCELAPFETLGDACAVYGIAVDELVADIQRAIAAGRDNDHRPNRFS